MILRELFAKLGLDVDGQSFAKGQLAVEGVKFALGKLVDAAEEVVSQFVENVKATAEYAEQIEGLGQATGLGTESLQKLGKAAAAEGIGIDEFSRSMILLDRTLVAAKDGNEEASKAFKKTGVAIKDVHGKLRPTEDIFIDMADGFQRMEDGAEKTALSMQLFGKSGAGMIQVLNNGRASLEEYMQAQVMTPEQIAAGKEMVLVQRQLTAQTKSLWRSAVAPLLPAITDLLKQYLAWKKANNDVMKSRIQSVLGLAVVAVKALGRAFAVATNIVAGLIGGLKVLGGWLLSFARDHKYVTGILIAGVLAYVTVMQWAAVRSALAWAASLAPIVAIAAAIGSVLLLVNSWKRWQDHKDSIFGDWMNALEAWTRPNATDPWWLRAIRELVRKMQQAIDLADRLGLSGDKGGTATPAAKAKTAGLVDSNTGTAPFIAADESKNKLWTGDARERYRQIQAQRGEGSAIFDRLKGVLGFEQAALPTVPTYTPTARPTSSTMPAGYGVMRIDKVEFNTQTQPGQNPEDYARAQRAEWETWANEKGFVGSSELEAAGAAAGPGR